MASNGYEAAQEAALSGMRVFDRDEIAALAGGLVLVPKNLHHLARLESLALCAVAASPTGTRLFSRTSARKLLNGLFADWVGFADDPCEVLATEAFTYNGGTHILISPEPNSLFALRLLSVLIARSEKLSPSYRHIATGLVQGICALSDLVVSRAGLQRNAKVPPIEKDISVPPQNDLNRILSAVRIKKAELDYLLTRTMLRIVDIESICLATVGLSLSSVPHETEHLQVRPLLRLKDEIVILAPHRLTEALVHRIVQLATEMGVHETLANEYHLRTFLVVDSHLLRLGLRSISDGLPARTNLSDVLVTHAIYRCDNDKVLHVAVVSDALHVGGAGIGAEWSMSELEEEIISARVAVRSWLANATPPDSEWLSLVIIGGIGRTFNISMATPPLNEPALLVFSAAELETIVLAEGAECSPLLLWRYAQARRDLESNCEFFSWSPLDAYAFWHDRDYVFPANVNMLMVDSSFGRGLREHAVAKYDWHAIPTPRWNGTIEVGLAEGPEQPIYVPRGSQGSRLEIAVERPGLVMWVVSPADFDLVKQENRANWLDVGRMIAYWLSEFSGHLAVEFANLGTASAVVIVEFSILAQRKTEDREVEHYRITPISPRAVRVEIYLTFVESYDDTNAVERAFGADLARCILLLGDMTADSVAAAVELALDTVAPIGVKRMMHCINTGQIPEFIGAAMLPRPRYAHPADCAAVRKVVLKALPLPNEMATNESVVSWLNDAVGIIYREMCDLLAGLNSQDLLKRLQVNNEALVHEDSVHEVTLSSQLACFRAFDSVKERLLRKGTRHVTASMVTRFLIEHVAAEPPCGVQLVSDLTFETLLAMGLEIVKLGIASDVARFELANVRLREDEGDLFIDQGSYEDAARGTLLDHAQERFVREIERERVQIPRRSTETGEPSALIKRLESATHDEFGVKMSIVTRVLAEAISVAQERSLSIVIIKRSNFAVRIRERLLVKDDSIERALDLLTLAPRPKFTKPPQGFHAGDIWPWRFNRALSYIRRPFVLSYSGEGESELIFTPGHVYRASNNLLSLISSGRLKARCRDLSALMGEFTREASDKFNEDVAELLRKRGFLIRARAAKFGKDRIVDHAGKSLGDIDVLCIDTARRRIIAIECKDFQVARVPHEVRSDLEDLFLSSERKRCAQEKHIRRIAWLQKNVEKVVLSMACDSTEAAWRVEGAFVFSVGLISPLLGHASFPVWTLQDLRNGTAP